jgi:hypothetical protein
LTASATRSGEEHSVDAGQEQNLNNVKHLNCAKAHSLFLRLQSGRLVQLGLEACVVLTGRAVGGMGIASILAIIWWRPGSRHFLRWSYGSFVEGCNPPSQG